MQLARLWPGLREICSDAPLNAAELAAALEGLTPVVRTLEALDLRVSKDADKVTDADPDTADEERIKPGAMPRAAAALCNLGGLRRLKIDLSGEPGTVGVLAPALQASTSLSSLELIGGTWHEGARPLKVLDLRPGPLRELTLYCVGKLNALRTMPRLGGVTKLRLYG